MEVPEWIEKELRPRECNSEEFFYDEMESQSGYCLPVIYKQFDLGERGHWRDRGAVFDFLLSTQGEGKKLLDFGPGDGWPSLIVAPFTKEIIGVDGSEKRVDVCRDNARRLGIANTEFVHVEVGNRLPFDDATFDGVMAASSIEQTPDPRATLRELYRVLKPGGRMRISYEDLDVYRGGREREVYIDPLGQDLSRVVIYDRHISEEHALMYSLVLSLSVEAAGETAGVSFPVTGGSGLSVEQVERLGPHVVEARRCRLTHPSGRTLVTWLESTGFSEVTPTHSGSEFAGRVFEALPEEARPKDIAGLDELLRPLIGIVISLQAPISMNPKITAVK
jgi:ubiquinone/menaquinone biosynthesis C-methylase UbiE